jgi:hypothetical protein
MPSQSDRIEDIRIHRVKPWDLCHPSTPSTCFLLHLMCVELCLTLAIKLLSIFHIIVIHSDYLLINRNTVEVFSLIYAVDAGGGICVSTLCPEP